jgi:hypothetical protein
VFHVSLLKKVVGKSQNVSSVLPSEDAELHVPEKVLGRRMITQGIRPVHRVLIKWSDSPESLAIWEDLEALRQRFPLAPAWGQAGPIGEGHVSNPDMAGTMLEPEARETEETQDHGPVEGKRAGRVRKPKQRYGGSEWVRE